jgi:hypothetical protein
MRNLSRAIRPFALIGGLALAITARADLPGENALPASTLAIVKVKHAAELRKALSESQFGQMIADPAMQPLKDDIKARLEETNGQLKQSIGVTLEELLETPQGPAWLAVIRREGETPINVLIAADAGSNSDRMLQIMTKGTEGIGKRDGTKISTESFKDSTLHIAQPPTDKEPAPPLVWTNLGSTFLIGVGLEAVKEVLANTDGREDSLGKSESYAAVKEAVDADANLLWYVDLGQVIKAGMQNVAEQGGDPAQADAMLGLLGANQLKAIGGSVRFGEGDFDLLAKTFIYAPTPSQGVFKVFQMPMVSMQPESWVPATVSSYQTISWDLDAAYSGLNELADQFLPGALENIERGMQGPGGETVRFQQDLFGPLGNRVSIIGDFKKPITEESQRSLVAIALSDAKAFQTTLNKLIAITGANPKKRDFQGTTIYDFEMPEIPAQPGAPQVDFKGPISVAIAKDSLFITTDTELLEQVLRPGGAALADSSEYQAVAKQFPTKLCGFSFNRPDEQARVAYDMFKGGQLKQAVEAANVAGPAATQLPDLAKYIDPAKIPEFSVFAKYLTDGGNYSTVNEKGLTIHQFSLKKATNP